VSPSTKKVMCIEKTPKLHRPFRSGKQEWGGGNRNKEGEGGKPGSRSPPTQAKNQGELSVSDPDTYARHLPISKKKSTFTEGV